MFTEVPRYVGFPNQIYVETKFAFDNFEKMFKNKAPFFVSTFRFKDKDTPIVDNLFFDIDSYYGVRIPWRNVKLLKNWCYRRDVPYIHNFSGQKGFHFFILLKPMIPKSKATQNRIRDLMYSVQMRIAKQTKIEAYDEPTFGRLRFLMRYPTSKYIRKDEDTGAFAENGMYCRYLTDTEFDSGVKRISRIVKEPGIVPKVPKSDISLQDIADMFPNFKVIHRADSKGGGELTERIFLQRAGMTVPTIPALGLPCLQEICKHSHPTHYERVELVSFLKFIGYTDIAITAFIKNRNWTRFKYNVTAYQVRSVMPRYPRCTFLKKSYGHLCKDCVLNR